MSTEKEQQKIPFFARLQVKYAMRYLAILALVLVLLNTYPLLAAWRCTAAPERRSRARTRAFSSRMLKGLVM